MKPLVSGFIFRGSIFAGLYAMAFLAVVLRILDVPRWLEVRMLGGAACNQTGNCMARVLCARYASAVVVSQCFTVYCPRA